MGKRRPVRARKPDDGALEKWIQTGSKTEEAEKPEAEKPATKRKVGRPKKAAKEATTVYFDPALKKKAKIFAIKNDMGLSELIDAAVRQFMQKPKRSDEDSSTESDD